MGKTREKKLAAVLTPENTDEHGQAPTDTDKDKAADKAADTAEDTPKNAMVTCPECGAEFEAPETPAEEPEETPEETPEEDRGQGTEDREQKECSAAPRIDDVKAAVKAALVEERKRMAAITALGAKFGFVDAAQKAVESDVTVDAFRKQILDQSPEAWKASLAVKNPSVQASADDAAGGGEAAAMVDEVKARRKAKAKA